MKLFLKWIALLPAYWILLAIIWLICSFLLQWFSSFGAILYWLTVPEVFLIGGIIFPIAVIITILDELNLPIKPALIILLLNNLLGIVWTLQNGGYNISDTVNTFGIVISSSSTLCIIILLFIKSPKESKKY